MFHRIRKHTISFKHAFHGLWVALKTQPNFQIHIITALVVLLASWKYHLTPQEWAIIVFTILWVLLTELINTAIESIVDLITIEYSEKAKIAKDVAAGAVLLGAIGSIIIACIIFIPKL
jgi:diacylglycerol kinase